MQRAAGYILFCVCFVSTVLADGPSDNLPDKVRRIPPPGVKVPDADRKELEKGLADLESRIAVLRTDGKRLDLLPDVQIYANAVGYALKYDEFFAPPNARSPKDQLRDVRAAKELLKEGIERANQLQAGKAPWSTAAGLVVRGYVSKIDGSVQPYGLVVPKSYTADAKKPFRLDIWLHGRGEVLSEVDFLNGRRKQQGEFAPPDAFVLHPYGRYCNANRFAGEVDVFEGMEHVLRNYRIDPDRIVVRGFSMGGAGCWQLATHHAGLWAAAAPGAGFSETAEFLNVFQNEKVGPTWYERKLWNLYDSTTYAANLFNCPTIAYSGEIDKQRQAAVAMETALKKEGMTLEHLIGPKTAHKYEPAAKLELARRIDALAAKGRGPFPKKVRLTTFTLKYNTMRWLTIDALQHHWERADVAAELAGNELKVSTKNVAAFRVDLTALQSANPTKAAIDGAVIYLLTPSAGNPAARFRKMDGQWKLVDGAEPAGPAKKHDLQGPIDDAFMSPFLFVRPTGRPMHAATGKWAASELEHAIVHWRRQFRGEARVKDDMDVTDEDAKQFNLVLFGDPSSNAWIAKSVAKLPVRWTAESILVGEASLPTASHMPALIYPNPANPKKYVVFNSGFTFREYDYLNNARQTPKLPDYAVFDVTTPITSRSPGKVAAAGFFGEKWEVQPKHGQR